MLDPESPSTDARTDCCTPSDHGAPADPRIARHFDDRYRGIAAAGELPKMVDVSRGLLGLLSDVADARPTLLELGSGSGALTVALLERGASQAHGVDLSAESIAVARRRAQEADVGGRATFEIGDAAQVALTPHDWVVLDRVICCYPNVDLLLANSIAAASRRFIFSVPHVRGWRGLANRIIVNFENATDRFRGRPCPGYLHDIRLVERRLRDAGFRPLRSRTVGLWYAAVFERPTTP